MAQSPETKVHPAMIQSNSLGENAINVGVTKENTAVNARTIPYENPVNEALASTG